MPDIGNINNRLPPATGAQTENRALDPGNVGDRTQSSTPTSTSAGALGQPTGLPVPGGGQVLPDVLAGREASQLAAAEQLRQSGGASAIDELLGLNRQPPIMGALIAPPGNLEALRHMTPVMRRTIMRNLIEKQRARLHLLNRRLRRSEREGDGVSDGNEYDPLDELLTEIESIDEGQAARARDELTRAARMLALLDDLLAMQDYTLSQMGTFSQG